MSNFQIKSSQEYIDLLATAPQVMVYLNDPEHQCIFASEALLHYLGCSQEDVRGERWKTSIHPQDLDKIETYKHFPSNQYSAFQAEVRVRRHDGQYRWVLEIGMPRFTPDGEFTGYAGLVVDIHERKILEEETLKRAEKELLKTRIEWQTLVENTPNIICTLSRMNEITFINRPFAGFEKDVLIGKNFLETVLRENHSKIETIHRHVFQTGDSAAYEVPAPAPGETQGWYNCRVGPIYLDGKINSLILILTDITAQRDLEKKILEVRDQEQEKIGRDLHDVLSQELLGIALVNTALHLKLVERGIPEAEEAEKISRRIKETIHQIRDLAHLLFPIHLGRIGFRSAVEELVHHLEQNFPVSFYIDIPSDLLVGFPESTTHFYRIVQEALTNGVRHGEAKNIVISLKQESDKKIHLKISDDGKGLSNSFSSHRGMGLAIMEHRAKMLGGSLEIQNLEPGGTLVQCSFPLPFKG